MRHNKKKTGTDLKKTPSNVTTTTLVAPSRLPRVQQHWDNIDKQGNKNWEFPRSKLKMKTILGQGNFGQVWKAEAEDMPGHEGKTRLVAVKTVKEGATEKEHKEFIKELEIMQQIGSHPNIVTLLGCCTDQEPNYLIMEYVKLGKLLTYLREHRVNENYYNFSNNSDALTSKDLTLFSYCISRGMEYLASRGIIHRDLAARNVLVDHNKVCKIADFGMSRSVRNFEDGQVYEERQHKGALPIRWMAPESLVYSVFTHKSDVWSFGIVMWEIVTLGSTPYPNMGAREIMRRVRDGYRLERPNHCKPEFYRLISHCWSHDPNKRPDFSELRKDLGNLLEDPSRDGSYVDLDRFAEDNLIHTSSSSSKSKDLRLLESGRECRGALKRYNLNWEINDWSEETRRNKIRKGKNNGKGTVTLSGQGSFTVNSRILEKEFKFIK
ncbi:cAMP-dependent protein kinase catalytic subunit, putative [Pediculus humanus corporis]|uniref:receptor protein-tyrosine kinase n=1 Tax=Pediculus humanus subsp. corporis TaxID=121224 RepID=E0VBC1_PEDHC|nr:cAMP-dependent protein kinase catalytic subunit, putative [Pediculus humanus corporis]EEB10677.1 cAMP-dependent protein kinase catalytic subunit, putative [Pediculus humanus corporis]